MLADQVDDLRLTLSDVADRDRAPQMAAYMKDRFSFLGVTSPHRRTAAKGFVSAGRKLTSAELLDAAEACWAEAEREFQYVGVDLLVRWVRSLESCDLGRVGRLIRTRSWWDTVDALAANVVGPMVATDASLTATIDQWIDDDDLWIARAAILHQLKYGDETDAARLFASIDRRSADADFFMRKACGWALREYAKTDPESVRRFVAERGDRLSGLTRREALKNVGA